MARERRQTQSDQPTEKSRRSTSTTVSAEDKKKRQREWYAKKNYSAVRIREKSRVQAAEKRAAIKAKRRKLDKPRTRQRKLTSDEFIASVALTQMREELPAVQRGTVSQTDSTINAPQPDARGFTIGAPLTSAEMAIDQEIEDLLEQGGEAQPSESESSSEDEDEDPDVGVGGVSATGGVAITKDNVCEMSGSQIQMRMQELKAQRQRRLRLPTPTPNSPSPEPEGPLPSFYEKLWRTVAKRAHTGASDTSSLV
ncbi:hypothetical protein B0H13DRAFT_1879894 [Mycena leptocephala]|nr:hypothetical protein B0H13DRAFT_1879894 [Mycena leptocephala]